MKVHERFAGCIGIRVLSRRIELESIASVDRMLVLTQSFLDHRIVGCLDVRVLGSMSHGLVGLGDLCRSLRVDARILSGMRVTNTGGSCIVISDLLNATVRMERQLTQPRGVDRTRQPDKVVPRVGVKHSLMRVVARPTHAGGEMRVTYIAREAPPARNLLLKLWRELLKAHCLGCHQPRSISDAGPIERGVAFARWLAAALREILNRV